MNLSLRNNRVLSTSLDLRDSVIQLVFWGLFVALLGVRPLLGAPMDASKLNQLHEIRLKQIPLLHDFIKKYPNSPKLADSMFRLGEAYFETAKYYQIKKVSSRATDHLNKSIKVLSQLQAKYPTYKRVDEAMFVMANAYREKGEVEKAGKILAQVAEAYPHSKVLQEASLLLGDYHFKKREYAKAKPHYMNALKREDVQPYVHYKLAWVAINRHQPAVALKHFESVIKLSGKVSSVDYTKEASREMAWPALQVYSTKQIMPYLEKVLGSGKLLENSMATLAKLLQQKGESSKASDVYDQLVAKFPQSESRQEWVSDQIKVEEKLGNSDKIVGLVRSLHGAGDSKKVQSQILRSAKKYHSLAQKEKNQSIKNSYYNQTATYYKAFLEVAEDNSLAAVNRFYYGEVLYELAQYNLASQQYEIASAVETDVQAKAAWNWYLTNEKLVTGFNYSGKNFQSTSETDELFLKSARRLQEVKGISLDQKRTASYQSARLLYQLNDYDRALPVFEHLALNYPTSKEGRLSKQLVLDIHNLKKDYEKVAEYAALYRQKSDSSEQHEFRAIEEKARLKKIQEDEKKAELLSGNDKLEALKAVAIQYYDFVRQQPNSKYADESLWTAIKSFAKVAAEKNDRRFQELRISFEFLNQRYPESKNVKPAIALLGEFLAYQEIEDQNILNAYLEYRPAWYHVMRKQPAEKSGLWGMLVYRLSNATQKKELEKRFSQWPVTEENRKAVALGRLNELVALRSRLYEVKLNSAKSLGKNTQKKIALLEKLQKDTTAIVDLKVGRMAVEALKVLAQGYYNVAEALIGAPVPGVLKGDDRAKYEAAVKEKAINLRNKGQSAEDLARKTASELDLI